MIATSKMRAFNLPITFTPIGFEGTIGGTIKSSVPQGAQRLFEVKRPLNRPAARRRDNSMPRSPSIGKAQTGQGFRLPHPDGAIERLDPRRVVRHGPFHESFRALIRSLSALPSRTEPLCCAIRFRAAASDYRTSQACGSRYIWRRPLADRITCPAYRLCAQHIYYGAPIPRC